MNIGITPFRLRIEPTIIPDGPHLQLSKVFPELFHGGVKFRVGQAIEVDVVRRTDARLVAQVDLLKTLRQFFNRAAAGRAKVNELLPMGPVILP